jgi:hypothetical protein
MWHSRKYVERKTGFYKHIMVLMNNKYIIYVNEGVLYQPYAPKLFLSLEKAPKRVGGRNER